jgi:endonuclease/exonuclease/phosphatase (EEP) superfamily protein YafD
MGLRLLGLATVEMMHRLRSWLEVALWVAGLILIAATLLPLLETNAWWIRVLDFPRVQIAALIAAVLAAAVVVLTGSGYPNFAFLALLVAALGYQIARILPFTPVMPVQAVAADGCEEDASLRLLIANVLQSNRDSRPLLDMVEAVDPDLVLTLESNGWWERELSVLEEAYPRVVRQPQEDTYGMHLYARLELVEPKVSFLLDDYVPSIETGVRLRSGALIDFHGVHPKPPKPAEDTDERDAELLIVGKDVAGERAPAVVAGDLNDVAWSQTNQLFLEISGLLGPRVGRGLYATHNADLPLLRWPLDHVFFEDSFAILDLRRMGDIGSDHFPIFIALCHQPEVAARQDEPEAEPEDEADAEAEIEEGREEAREPE